MDGLDPSTQPARVHARTRFIAAPTRRCELAELITAEHWGAEYEFDVQTPEALKAGHSQAEIGAWRAGKAPSFEDDDSKLIFEFATTFFAKPVIPYAFFQEAVARLGRRRF